MKKYIIFKFESRGIFYCIENTVGPDYIILEGSFENNGDRMTFLKMEQDKAIN